MTIAVVDTGANLRVPEIAAKHPATYDVRTRGRDVRDLNGHGTHVASIIARSSGNARLLIIRAGSSSGAFSDANEAAAIRYAVDHGARIVNLSLGGPRTSSVERAAVRYAIGRGVLVVAAAGDDYASRPEYPAALLGADGLAVAAVTRDGDAGALLEYGPLGLGCGARRGRNVVRRAARLGRGRTRLDGESAPLRSGRSSGSSRRPPRGSACATTSSATA